MHHTERSVQVGGAWLAIASCLMIAALALHGPIAPGLPDQMTRIAGAADRWRVAHWIAAAGLSSYVVTALIVLTSRSRLTDGAWLLSAWAVVGVGCLWTSTTAIAEATVITEAALSGRIETFEAWWRFAEGKANGFAIVALPVAVIAVREARDHAGATPAWAAWISVVAAVSAFGGWVLGMWFGIAGASLVWVAGSIAMSVWTLWFGVALMRTPVAGPATGRPARVARPATPPPAPTPSARP